MKLRVQTWLIRLDTWCLNRKTDRLNREIKQSRHLLVEQWRALGLDEMQRAALLDARSEDDVWRILLANKRRYQA
jgi:hypothetical protein